MIYKSNSILHGVPSFQMQVWVSLVAAFRAWHLNDKQHVHAKQIFSFQTASILNLLWTDGGKALQFIHYKVILKSTYSSDFHDLSGNAILFFLSVLQCTLLHLLPFSHLKLFHFCFGHKTLLSGETCLCSKIWPNMTAKQLFQSNIATTNQLNDIHTAVNCTCD